MGHWKAWDVGQRSSNSVFGRFWVVKSNLTPPPPGLNKRDYRYPGNQSDYATIDRDELPMGESMQQTLARLKPYWQDTIQPEVGQGKHVLIVSHRNTLRALMMLLDHLTPAQVMKLKLATGRPLVYELDQQCNALRHYYIDKLV